MFIYSNLHFFVVVDLSRNPDICVCVSVYLYIVYIILIYVRLYVFYICVCVISLTSKGPGNMDRQMTRCVKDTFYLLDHRTFYVWSPLPETG